MIGTSLLSSWWLYNSYYGGQNPSEPIGKEPIKYIIEETDRVSLKKGQVNWQEVITILIMNYGENLEQVPKGQVTKLANELNEAKTLFNSEEKKSPKDAMKKLGYVEFNQNKYDEIINRFYNIGYYGQFETTDHRLKFINELSEAAKKIYKERGILPSVIIAQAILESGWGNSKLTIVGNNIFGIKADKSWKGSSISLETKEYVNTVIVGGFRAYKSKGESLEDYGRFLIENPRYEKNGFFKAKTYIGQAQALEDAGYSTAQNEKGEKIYQDKLVELIRQYNLQLLDCE